MGLLQVVCIGLLAAVARSQGDQNCTSDTSTFTVNSTEDSTSLATALGCSNGDFSVWWVGEVFVAGTIHVANGTSLNITGAGPGARADGQNVKQLFYVEGGSRLHLSDMTLANGSASDGGAVYALRSSVSFTGNTSFISNSADHSGGAIFAQDHSTVYWDGDGTQFSNNSADYGSAIFAQDHSTVSWDGDGTQFSSNSADNSGGAIFASDSSTVSWGGDDTHFSSNSAGAWGGAIVVLFDSTVSWDGNGTQFSSNSARYSGGAIFAFNTTTVSWDGDDTHFSSNSAGEGAGAIMVLSDSTVSWDGDGTHFSNNSADLVGGAIFAFNSSAVSWDGDDTLFSNNSAGDSGGAIYASNTTTVSWDGDGTQFSSNSAGYSGGAISAQFQSAVSWDGDGTQYSSNYAAYSGGAIYAYESTVSWDGDGTQFSSNSAEHDGGAISSWFSSIVSWNGPTTFESNVAGVNGGALHSNGCDSTSESGSEGDTAGAKFTKNSATYGGALYLSTCKNAFNFAEFTFEKNSAFDGGAVAAYESGSETFDLSVVFFNCTFSDNVASGSGGAVETLAGQQEFVSCDFKGNSADIGGAMRLGGSAVIRECSFLSNFASTRGLAIAVVGWSASISGSLFDGNELSCPVGLYRNDTEKEETTARFETVCFDCHTWDECSDCSITRGTVTPECDAPLEHSSAKTVGVTLETLSIDEGYWRAANESDSILACYKTEACSGGQTGSHTYCAPGYKGPYCAVCDTTYSSSLAHTCTRCSSSRRQGLMAATVITAIVTIIRYMLSTELEEGNVGCFHRRVVRAVPLQALKIIVVVWQILTQFADAANVSYPGVYQEFMSAIDVINFDLGSVLAAGCVWPDIDFHDRLLVTTLGPLVVVGFLAMTYWIATRRNTTDHSVVENIRRKHQTAFLLLTFLIYSSVSSTVFQTFACEALDDGVEYLRADYRIHCTDAKHNTFEVYAGIMIAVYPLGIPLLYAILLFQRRDVLADAGADKTVAQPIAGLWEPYRPERFYYEIVECGRRVLLTGVVVFIFPNDAAQIAITLLTTFVFLMFFEALSPYKSESDMWLSRGGHAIVFLSMSDLLLLKVDVSDERDQSQAVFAGVLVAGHVLMILAIDVEVVGICYASGGKRAVEDARFSERLPDSRPRAGSDDVPPFEHTPASWKSFLRQGSVSEKAGPTRNVARTVVTAGRP